MYAATDEIAALAEVASSHGGIYTSHIRSEGSALMEAIDEAVTIGRIADIPVQVSHLKASGVRNWHKMPKAVEAIEKARSQGLDVSADMYAYNASNTSLSSLISGWAHVGGHETMLKRLQNPGLRKQLTSELANEMDAEGVGWDAILISDCAPMPELQGMTIMQIAEKWNLSPLDTVMDVLIKTDLIADIIEFSMTEENVALGLQQPWVSVCTDAAGRAAEGPFSIGKPHPRNYGSFPRILGYYCRELEIFSMEEAIRKMTSLPASKLGLKHRGLLTSGYAADVVVFDPLTVRDTATFKQPHQYPIGIEWVLVNGQVVIAGGEHQRTRPGVVETR
jgi:N-acyl-D-aspartate/D-glutamate deacylase